jgi:hypothetical protein
MANALPLSIPDAQRPMQIEGLVHDQDALAIADVQQFRGGRVV